MSDHQSEARDTCLLTGEYRPTVMASRRTLLGGILALGASQLCQSSRGVAFQQSTPWPEAGRYASERARFSESAHAAAFGRDAGLEPELGFGPNRARLIQLYDYYGALSERDPDRFLWAGLARLAGASVIAGLDRLVSGTGLGYADPSPLTIGLTGIAGAVFTDLAWLHEAFLADPGPVPALAAAHDTAAPARTSYAVAWTLIASDDTDAQADGNRALLANEQFSIVQPAYDLILADPSSGSVLRVTGALVPAVHPYHDDFRASVPGGDLTDADDRWRWIAGSEGMWEPWVALPPSERGRLVGLPLDDIIARRW